MPYSQCVYMGILLLIYSCKFKLFLNVSKSYDELGGLHWPQSSVVITDPWRLCWLCSTMCDDFKEASGRSVRNVWYSPPHWRQFSASREIVLVVLLATQWPYYTNKQMSVFAHEDWEKHSSVNMRCTALKFKERVNSLVHHVEILIS